MPALNSRELKVSHKHSAELPSTVEYAREIDKKNSNELWRDKIEKKTCNTSICFDILEEVKHSPKNRKKEAGHLIFYVKIYFTRKDRWVLDFHKTPSPEGSTFSRSVSRDLVLVAFVHAALRGLDAFYGGTRSPCLQAPSSEKHCIARGPGFRTDHKVNRALIERAAGEERSKQTHQELFKILREILRLQAIYI